MAARSRAAMALTKVTATTAATSRPVTVAAWIARLSRPMRRFWIFRSWASRRAWARLLSSCWSWSVRARSITRDSRLVSTPSSPEMPVTRNTGATDNWIARARPITGAGSLAVLVALPGAARLTRASKASALIRWERATGTKGRLKGGARREIRTGLGLDWNEPGQKRARPGIARNPTHQLSSQPGPLLPIWNPPDQLASRCHGFDRL